MDIKEIYTNMIQYLDEQQQENKVFMVIGTALCIICAATAAGLTMGLLSLDPLALRVMLETDERDCRSIEEVKALRKEKQYAKRVLPIIQRHHFLLVTLLLLNSLANEAMPIFLDGLTSKIGAILLSVTFVLIFGEIVPSAIFTGPSGLKLSAALSPLVIIFMIILGIVAYPISKLLDYLLGHEIDQDVGLYTKARLKALLRLHITTSNQERIEQAAINSLENENLLNDELLQGDDLHKYQQVANQLHKEQKKQQDKQKMGSITYDEYKLAHNAMSLNEITAESVMTPIEKVFMLSDQTLLSIDTLADLISKGFSRIPVYKGNDRKNLRGLLLSKKLMAIDPNDSRKVSELGLREPIFIGPKLSLSETLHEMQRVRSHLAIVTHYPEKYHELLRDNLPINKDVAPLGMITIMDVIIRLMGIEADDNYRMGAVLDGRLHKSTSIENKLSSGDFYQKVLLQPTSFTATRLRTLAARAKTRVAAAKRKRKESSFNTPKSTSNKFANLVNNALGNSSINQEEEKPKINQQELDDEDFLNTQLLAEAESFGGNFYSPAV